VVVLAVEADGPAFRTDLRPADVIQNLNGKPVASALDLQRRLFEMKTGQSVRLGIWRQGSVKSLSIPLAELPSAPQVVLDADHGPRSASTGQDRFGLTLREIKGRGLKVESLAEGSVAGRSDLQRFDIITEVENHPVRTLAECIGALRSAFGRSGTGVALLQIEREGRRTFILLHGS
jgi:S1-C subfamily serine protease